MMRNRVYALLLAVLSCAFAQAAAKSSPFTVDGLKCENMRAPLGIDNTSPHFSWLLHTPAGATVRQHTRYRWRQTPRCFPPDGPTCGHRARWRRARV